MICPQCKYTDDDELDEEPAHGPFFQMSNGIVAQRFEHYGEYEREAIHFCPQCGIGFIDTGGE